MGSNTARQEVLASTAAQPHTSVASPFAARPSDRTAIAVLVAMVWVGIVSGFGMDSLAHIQRYGLDYPLIVHGHAIVFVGWLCLFTVQMTMIRSSRVALHRKIGIAGAGLAGVMLILGPLTALTVAQRSYASDGMPPVFLSIELGTITAFAGLTLTGLLMRRRPAAHKRLMLLGLIYLSTPGFARFLNGLVAAQLNVSFSPRLVQIFFFTDCLILAMGAYDLSVRRRLHPAYLVGAVSCIALQFLALTLLTSPSWQGWSLRLIGH